MYHQGLEGSWSVHIPCIPSACSVQEQYFFFFSNMCIGRCTVLGSGLLSPMYLAGVYEMYMIVVSSVAGLDTGWSTTGVW